MFFVNRFKTGSSGVSDANASALASPEMVLKSVRSNMMTKTQDQVMMRARTRIQASGELKVEHSSSVKVFFDPRGDTDPASPFLASMTMVVVEERAKERRQSKVRHLTCLIDHQLFRCEGLIQSEIQLLMSEGKQAPVSFLQLLAATLASCYC